MQERDLDSDLVLQMPSALRASTASSLGGDASLPAAYARSWTEQTSILLRRSWRLVRAQVFFSTVS